MNTVIKISIRIALVVIILFISNEIYKRFFYPQDLEKHADVLTLLPTPADSAQIIYFGESSNFTQGGADIDKRSISNIVAAYYPNLKLSTANKGALHAGIYKALLQNIPQQNEVQTIIVTMNLRSFGADWIYSGLETALQKSIVLIKPGMPLINRINLSFKGYQLQTDLERKAKVHWHWKNDPLNFPYQAKYSNTSDWDHGQANEGIRVADGSVDYKKTELACHYVKSYAFDINPDKNPRIKDFDDIVDICKKRGWNLVFNLLAENTEMGGKLIGDDLLFLMRRNRDFLVNRYHSKGAVVVDNLEDVASKYYIDQAWTTEHYTEEGRHTIARNVADSLKLFYASQFRAIDIPKIEQQSLFTFDGEQPTNWKSQQTITDEMSASATHSSKTNAEMPFGITLEIPLKEIPDSCRNEVEVQFKVRFIQPANEVKLVFELLGNEVANSWNGVDIKVGKVNDWCEFSYRFKMSDLSILKYQTAKIYLWNNSGTTVYSDDWVVQFK